MNDRLDMTPVALYARVSSDRQDVDLSVAAQLRALRDYAEKNGYLVAREYVDEAESGRIADRPQFTKMLDEASKPEAPFKEILVWKFSRFTRKREHAVAFKSMLRRRGIRVVSITEQADDTPTGKLLEAIIESVDEFYSENLVSVYAFPESAVQVSPSSLTFNEFNWNTPQYVSIETIVDHDALNAWAVVVHDIDGPAGAYIHRVFVRVVVDDQDEQSDDGS